MSSTTLHLALNGNKLSGFEGIRHRRTKVKSEVEFRAWEAEYQAWRWSHDLLGQFNPREVKYAPALPGGLELVLENPRYKLFSNSLMIDHRFEAEACMNTSFADVPWLVTDAKLMSRFSCANPLPRGFVEHLMRQRDAVVFIVREAEGNEDRCTFDHTVVIETALGFEGGPGPAKTPRDHYAALSVALHEVLCMSFPKSEPPAPA